MKIFLVVAIGQLFLMLTRGSEIEKEAKRVVCFYLGLTNPFPISLHLEDIDATLCTHLVLIEEQPEGIYNQTYNVPKISNTTGYAEKFQKLREVNPKLKILLYVRSERLTGEAKTPSGKSDVIKGAVDILKLNGLNGIIFKDISALENKEGMADLFCEMQSEFDKHGFIVSVIINKMDNAMGRDSTINKISRCCKFITLRTIEFWDPSMNTTRLSSTLTLIRSEVEKYLEKGLPADKLVVTFPAFSIIVSLTNVNQTGLGASISGPGIQETREYQIIYNQLVKKMNDPSEEWTIHRDEATNAPYAYNKKGQWASYDDASSMATKANYVLRKNLGGVVLISLDMDDVEGFGGEGKFPLTRAIRDTLNRGLQADNSISVSS